MPCIEQPKIYDNSPLGKNPTTTLCGKLTTPYDKRYRSIKQAIESNGPICNQCKKLANIQSKPPAPKLPVSPFDVYHVSEGKVTKAVAIKETKTGYRLGDGSFHNKHLRKESGIWKAIGGEGVSVVTTANKDEAIELAKKQRERLDSFIAEVLMIREELSSDSLE